MSKAIVILGMHRSGTSALCDLLSRCGASLSSNLLGGVRGINDRGFFEDKTIVDLNQKIFSQLGRDWYDLTLIEKSELTQLPAALSKLALEYLQSEYAHYALSVIKDPRFCLLLPFWEPVFLKAGIQLHFVFVYRSIGAIASSLQKRDGFSPEVSTVLWLNYMLSAFKQIHERPVVKVAYQDLLENPEKVVEKVSQAFDLRLTAEAGSLSAIDPQQQHFKDAELELESFFGLKEFADHVYSDLSSADSGLTEHIAPWDQWHEETKGALEVLNSQLVQFVGVNQKLHELGELYTHAQAVVGERDSTIEKHEQTIEGQQQVIQQHEQTIEAQQQSIQQHEKTYSGTPEAREYALGAH